MSVEAVRTSVARARVVSIRGGRLDEGVDLLATEEPLEIRAHGPGQEPVRVAVTMRTPGHDFELAAGFLLTEGLIDAGAVATIAYCEDPDAQRYNVVTVRTRSAFDLGSAERNFFATSSCGICGKAALEAVAVRCAPLAPGPLVSSDTLIALPDRLREGQRIFGRTGGVHAAGLFSAAGELLLLREDVGRHNAVDKVVGARELGDPHSGGAILMVSGRLSFEIVQKAAVAGIPVLCGVSAPTSLAVAAARDLGVTLVGLPPRPRLQRLLRSRAHRDGRSTADGPRKAASPGSARQLAPERDRPRQAEPLLRDGAHRLGEPAPPALRRAHPAKGRLRRLRPRASPVCTTGPSAGRTSARLASRCSR